MDIVVEYQIYASKSAALIVTRAKKSVFPSGLYLNGEPVPNVPVICHLGLTISSDLSWSVRVQSLVGSQVNLLKRLAFRARLSIPVFSLLYKCLVRSCLEYASPVWNGCSTADSRSLERIQLSLARAILYATFGSSFASNLSSSVQWLVLSLSERKVVGSNPPMVVHTPCRSSRLAPGYLVNAR